MDYEGTDCNCSHDPFARTRFVFASFARERFFNCFSTVNGQTQITGRVLDQVTGESLVGASVYLEEYATGGMTDFDGNFRFSTRQTGEAHVVVSMIGYEMVRTYIQLPARQGGNLGMAA